MSNISFETFSEHFHIEEAELDKLGVFNRFMEVDSKYFIERRLLGKSKSAYMRKADIRLNNFISMAMSSEQCIEYYINKNEGYFDEADNIGLGSTLTSTKGRGTSKKNIDKLEEILVEAYNSGLNHIENLLYASNILVKGIGEDKTSDFIANVIKDDIDEYTRDICNKLSIPYEKLEGIKLLPKDILVQMPADFQWSDYERETIATMCLNDIASSKIELYEKIIDINMSKSVTKSFVDNTYSHIKYQRDINSRDINKILDQKNIKNEDKALIIISRLTGGSMDNKRGSNKIICRNKVYQIYKSDKGIYQVSESISKQRKSKRYIKNRTLCR